MARLKAEEIIAEKSVLIKKRIDYIVTHPNEDHSSRYATMGMMSHSIAMENLLLANKSEAKYWFAESIKYYLKSIPIEKMWDSDNYAVALKIAQSLIPTGNKELINGISALFKIIVLRDDVKLFQYYIRTQSCIILDDIKDTKANLKELEKYEPKWKKHKFYEGLVDAYSGIIDKDKEKVIKGASRVLEIFKKRVPQTREPPICLVATNILLIARDKGIDIDINVDVPEKLRKYIPQVLFE